MSGRYLTSALVTLRQTVAWADQYAPAKTAPALIGPEEARALLAALAEPPSDVLSSLQGGM